MVGIKILGAWEQLFCLQPPFPARPVVVPGCGRAVAARSRAARSPPGLVEGGAADPEPCWCHRPRSAGHAPLGGGARDGPCLGPSSKPVRVGAAKPGRERFATQLGFPAALSRQRVFGLGLATLHIQVRTAGVSTSCP